ncbi:MAG: alanine--glyoxylate aminotransferase family protein [Anaerovoracaceae bacterium]
MYKIMTAGPTRVKENVMKARSMPFTNPDIDLDFYEFYKETCDLLSKAMHTNNKAYILGGEGILGLEAACASLTEPEDRVLVIDNGIFGRGFCDFVTIYGGKPVLFSTDYHRPVDQDALRKFLENDHDFKYATVVHCDTPSGVLNDIKSISNMLKEYNILTVVDSVAGMFGEYVNVDESKIDILCGGSQKALSAPPGLSMVWISDDAFKSMENRKKPIGSFYGNLLAMKNYYEEKWFPYTMPISDIMGLRVAIENVLADKSILQRHYSLAEATRKAVSGSGLKLYLDEGYSNTVTVIEVPTGVTDQDILEGMKKDYGVMISGCFDVLAGKVIRIGHMGENAYKKNLIETMEALEGTLLKNGVKLKGSLVEIFKSQLK